MFSWLEVWVYVWRGCCVRGFCIFIVEREKDWWCGGVSEGFDYWDGVGECLSMKKDWGIWIEVVEMVEVEVLLLVFLEKENGENEKLGLIIVLRLLS